MNLVVIGDGLLGSRIRAIFPEAIVLSHADVDVTSQDSLVRAFRAHRPDVVVNTAAIHSLPRCEAEQDRAFDVNARGPERIGRLGVPQLYLSTDYVFHDGGPHDEVMPGRQPRSVYGRSKLAGELAALEFDGIVVRVSGLYDYEFQSHKGQSFPETIAKGWGDTIRLPNDQRFSPTYAPDAAQRIVDLAIGLATRSRDLPLTGVEAKQRVAGIYHAANAGTTTWAEFAENVLEVTRTRRTIQPHAAKDPLRPVNSALRSTRLPPLRHWRLALTEWSVERERVIFANAVSPLRSKA